jgi:hypothetical protein
MQARSLWTKVATLIVLALLMAAASGWAPPVRGPANTHLGVPPNNLVTLVSQPNPNPDYPGIIFRRVLPSGMLTEPFTVPSGQVLIVTDIDVDSFGYDMVYLSLTNNVGVAFLEPGRSYHFTGGFVVPAGYGLWTGDVGFASGVYIRGYLMPAQTSPY